MEPFMKKYITFFIMISALIMSGCKQENPKYTLKFGVAAEYPPFEYSDRGKITGFDIELAQLIAQELGKEAIFEDMQFSTLLAALQSSAIDAAISTLTITEDRQKNFDFSDPYYKETLATVFPKENPITHKSQLSHKKIGCQLGATMEIWLREHVLDAEIIALNDSNQIIEALKAGHIDVALMDGFQGSVFSQKNPELSFAVITESDTGYGIAFEKDSPLKDLVNKALKSLENKGELKELQQKWFGVPK